MQKETSHEKWMTRALELAQKGWGRTSPNPLVGCVIVRDNRIIAKGYHAACGLDHAERAALKNAAKSGLPLRGATLYVNLEPCSHHGRTPPCTGLIIESGIRTVVVAMEDPNPLVAGRGILALRAAGIEVRTGVLEQEAAKLNEIFSKYITTGRPFVLLKSAISVDGKIAANSGDSKWISGEESRRLVHHWRSRVSAIMAGRNTIAVDNPSLTARMSQGGGQNPVRVILDSRGSLPLASRVFQKDGTRVILAATSAMTRDKRHALESAGVEVICLDSGQGQIDLPGLMRHLGQQGLDSVMLEGGGRLNEAFLKAGLIDKIMLFMAPKIIGGSAAPSVFSGEGINLLPDSIKINDMTVSPVGKDWLIEGYPEYEGM